MIKFRGRLYKIATTRSAKAAPRIQYHSAPRSRLQSILEKGLQLPRSEKDVQTFQHSEIATISTSDEADYAAAYNPSGVLFTLAVSPQSKWLFRTARSQRKNENLLQAAQRWVAEAYAGGYDAVHVGEGIQSTLGNQILQPSILTIIEYELLGQA